MARTYTNSLAETPSSYPTVYTPVERLNKGTYPTRVENFTVPAVADPDGRYRVELDNAINSNVTPIIDSGTDSDLPRIPYPAVPGVNEVGVSVKDVPILEFHASRAGESGTIEYSPLGSVRTSGWENQIQNELVALGTYVAGGGGALLAGLGDTDIDGTQADGDVLTWDDAAGMWVAAAPAGGGGEITIADVTDLQTTLTTLDSNITTAQQTADNAQSTADGKQNYLSLGATPQSFLATSAGVDGTEWRELSAADLTSGTLDAARLPVVPVANGGTNVTDLTGQAGKYVKVNAGATGYEFDTPSGGGGGGVADPTGNGIVAKTGSGTSSARTITGTTGKITITNGDGVSGNPTITTGANVPLLDTANTFTATQSFSTDGTAWATPIGIGFAGLTSGEAFELGTPIGQRGGGFRTSYGSNGVLHSYNSLKIRGCNRGGSVTEASDTGPCVEVYGSAAEPGHVVLRVIGASGAFNDTFQLCDSSKVPFVRVDQTGNTGIAQRLVVGTATPVTSGAYVQGTSYSTAIVNKTANYTATDADSTITANATSAAFQITLPTAVGRTGQLFTIKKTDASANAVTVGTTSSQTIDGSTTYSLSTQNQFVTVQSNNANWLIVGKG